MSTRHRALRCVVTALVATVIATLAPPVATASGALGGSAPLTLTDQFTDKNGVVGARSQQVRDALADLSTDTSYRLWVVYVDTFEEMSGSAWAHESARESNLGAADLLLAVATTDRQYVLLADTDVDLSGSQLADIEAAAAQALNADDWAGAAIGAAQATRQVATGRSAASGLPDWAAGALGVAGVALVALGVSWLRRHRSAGKHHHRRPAVP